MGTLSVASAPEIAVQPAPKPVRRPEPLLVALVVGMAVVMATYCVVRYTNFGAGLDLYPRNRVS